MLGDYPPGQLKILVHSARDLESLVTVGEQQPYYILEVGGHRSRSKPCLESGRNPVWNTAHKFDVADEEMGKITIKDEVTKGVIGEASFPLDTARINGKDNQSLLLTTLGGQNKGLVVMKMKFSSFSSEEQSPLKEPGRLSHGATTSYTSPNQVKEHFRAMTLSPLSAPQLSSSTVRSPVASDSQYSDRSTPKGKPGEGVAMARFSSALRRSPASAGKLRVSTGDEQKALEIEDPDDPEMYEVHQEMRKLEQRSSMVRTALMHLTDELAEMATPVGVPVQSPSSNHYAGSQPRSTPPLSPVHGRRPSETRSSDSHPRPGIPALASLLMSQTGGVPDPALVEDLITMYKKADQELKNYKVAYEEQATELANKKAHIEELQSSLKLAEDEKEGLMDEVRALQQHLASLEGEQFTKMKALKEEAAALKQQVNAGASSFTLKHEALVEELQREISEAQAAKEEAEGKLAALQQERQPTQEELQRLQRERDQLSQELGGVKGAMMTLVQEKTELEEALGVMEMNSQQEVNKLQAKLAELQGVAERLAEVQEENSRLAQELVNVQDHADQWNDSKEETEYLQEQLRKAWSQVIQLQHQVQVLESGRQTPETSQTASGPQTQGGPPNSTSPRFADDSTSESDFLMQELVATKLELAQLKEQQVKYQRELFKHQSMRRINNTGAEGSNGVVLEV